MASRSRPGKRGGEGEAEAVAVVGAYHASVDGSQLAYDEVRAGESDRDAVSTFEVLNSG